MYIHGCLYGDVDFTCNLNVGIWLMKLHKDVISTLLLSQQESNADQIIHRHEVDFGVWLPFNQLNFEL